MSTARISVAIVDDSAVVRRHLGELLARAGIEVLFTAGDPLFAWPKLQACWPDVIVLDVEMPRMDGISFLRQIMRERPTPVVMCSTLTAAGAATTVQALAEGAVACVGKPTIGLREFMGDPGSGLVDAIRAAAQARMGAARAPARPETAVTLPPPAPTLGETSERVLAIGASTGGVQAIERVLMGLPRTTPGVLIVQHMPAQFTSAFAERLDGCCAMEVREAADGDRVMPGRVLIAPGGRHLQLRRSGAQYLAVVRDGPLVNRHRPSVDVLFRSVAQQAGRNAAGVVLTGMGDDGARGLLEMSQAGAATAAQDEASCVVYGMPRAALERGAAQHTLPLDRIAAWLARSTAAAAAVS
jgi:two-component system chemotaxis response regulator CheB